MRRPASIVYGVDDSPPVGVTILSGLQHVGLVSIFLLVPVLACRQAGLPPEKIVDVLSLSMLVMAIGPVLQQLGRGGVGSGYLCPTIFAAPYLPASILAIKAGGLPLMFGMTIFAGFAEITVSRLFRRLRPLFPPEIAGFVVVMIGVTIGNLGFRSLFATTTGAPPGVPQLAVAAVTLGTMVALNVWTKGATKLFCALIGMVFGYVVAVLSGVLPAADMARLAHAPLARLPDISHLGWKFDVDLVIPFAVAAVAASLRAMGDVTICQKTNDADWKRPDMVSISGGALANGIGTVLSGVLGTVGTNTSTSNVGLAAATGVTSRKVAYATGAIYLLLAFVPMGATVFVIMPGAVVGATLVFASCLVFVNGLQIITARLLDARRTFVIGLSFMLGLTVDVMPGVFADLPSGLRQFTSSSLLLGTLTALILNLVFRLGVRRNATLIVDPAHVEPTKIEAFMEINGAAWGARRDVIDRARFNLVQSIETLASSGVASSPLDVLASFDEFRLDVRVSYVGLPLEFPENRPSNEDIIASEVGERRLAGFLLRRSADRVSAVSRDGHSTILFHFDH
ncbi:MAG: solute carrier family 23 protein [Betaproteobacteria bacterium]